MEARSVALTPYENFLYALKAEETKRQYPHRLDKFLTFMGLRGTIQEKCSKLDEYGNGNVNLLQSNIIRFTNFQRERIVKKELSEGTLQNYIKALKLFYNLLTNKSTQLWYVRRWDYFRPLSRAAPDHVDVY
jgi:hypothetical protein